MFLDKPLIDQLLYKTFEMKASDLHVSVGSPPMLRIDGSLAAIGSENITAAAAEEMAHALFNNERQNKFYESGEIDFAFMLEGKARFRINVYKQRGHISIAARLIPTAIPTLEQLRIPDVVSQLILKPQGLILVTGPTGSGKSSTLAAMLNYINRTQKKHIVTLEDPIEFVHHHGTSLVHQREIGRDTNSFSSGLRAALRQDPDVILVGEMRDLETISAAVSAAETGHLVMATLHTSDAPQTIDRIIDAFPGEQQAQIRAQLASVLLGVISQRLFKRAGGTGRICATEILINNSASANLIRTDKVHQIKNVMQTGRMSGMSTLEMTLLEMLQYGLVDPVSAKAYLSEARSDAAI